MIRRINDIIRALLIHAHLPPIFWVEALHTATYLHNILPSKRLNYNTPFFALYQRHPTYDHLRVFGCPCYPNTSATQPRKLHSRSIRCIFIGYPQNYRGYRCLDPTTGRVYLSRHVIFDEHTFPFNQPTSPSTYNFLDDDPLPISMPIQFPSSTPIPTNSAHTPTPSFTSTNQPPSPQSPPSTSQNPNPSAQVPTPIPPPSAPTSSTLPNPPTHTTQQTNTHPMTTRAKQGITKPNPKYSLAAPSSQNPISPVQTSYIKALSDPNWLRAMHNEFSAL